MTEPKAHEGQIVDLIHRRIFTGQIVVQNGKIVSVAPCTTDRKCFLIPGFVNAHVHIESCLGTPSQVAPALAARGVVATVSDPHEIANVLGVPGVEFMLNDARNAKVKMFFGAPSCVPATDFETAGARIGAAEIEALLGRKEIRYLAEMMNWPGVLNGDPEVLKKIEIARRFAKPVDGHAPGLRGEDARRYIAAGISTDHESTSVDEALDKLQHGLRYIQMRRGSAADDSVLWSLVNDHFERLMFCSDDLHPDLLLEGSIDCDVRNAVAGGADPLKALTAACLNPVQHYHLPVGLLRAGDPADFLVVNDLRELEIQQVHIGGELVAQDGRPLFSCPLPESPNTFHAEPIEPAALKIGPIEGLIRVIDVIDGKLVTKSSLVEFKSDGSHLRGVDILKLVVVNRYMKAPPAIAFVRNFGLLNGALASSVAHDSHNIIAVGVDDQQIAKAINAVIRHRGALSFICGEQEEVLPLPVAGLMSNRPVHEIAARYSALDRLAKSELGSKLRAPYMSLSFLALLVIPELKLSDKGLFDGLRFTFAPLYLGKH